MRRQNPKCLFKTSDSKRGETPPKLTDATAKCFRSQVIPQVHGRKSYRLECNRKTDRAASKALVSLATQTADPSASLAGESVRMVPIGVGIAAAADDGQ